MQLTCEDNMELMARYPDKYFDLAIVDPPYGIGGHLAIGNGYTRKGRKRNKVWIGGDWDLQRPNKKYFDELLRVSKNQIIWGGNYFADILPQSFNYVIWDKVQRVNQSDCELAWTSFNGALRIFSFHASNLMGFRNPFRFHPTEKPIDLYKWLLSKYAKPNDKILDTHLGSMSIAIACHDLGFELTGCELDPEYYEKGIKRLEDHKKQLKLL